MYYTSNAPGLQVSLALPRFVCPHTPPVGFSVFAQFLRLSGFGHAPLFARFSHRECVRSLCALPQALHTSPINPLPALFSFSRARLFISPPFRTMTQHKTSFLHVRKISTVNQIHQSVSPCFGPAPLLHPASALVRCFAHCFCPIAMLFSLSYSLYNKFLWQNHGKRITFRSPSVSMIPSFLPTVSIFPDSLSPKGHFFVSATALCYLSLLTGRYTLCPGRSVSPLQAAFQAKRFSLYSALHPRPQRQAALPLPYYFFLPLPIALIFSLYCSGLSLFSPVPLADFLIQKRAQSALFDVLRINSYAFCSLASSLVVKTFLLL